MNIQQQALHDFILYWQKKVQTDEGITKSTEVMDTQKFWSELIYDVFGESKSTFELEFEKRINLINNKNKNCIDLYIPKSKILIEQKCSKQSLSAKYKQSDGTELTPFEEAKRYNDNLMFSERGKYIITCNFKEFRIYDLDKKIPEQIIKLSDLENEIYRLELLVKSE